MIFGRAIYRGWKTSSASKCWRIERDYQDIKQPLGFDKVEGRSWGGLHRHLAMVTLLHAFIALPLEDFSPSVFDGALDVG